MAVAISLVIWVGGTVGAFIGSIPLLRYLFPFWFLCVCITEPHIYNNAILLIIIFVKQLAVGADNIPFTQTMIPIVVRLTSGDLGNAQLTIAIANKDKKRRVPKSVCSFLLCFFSVRVASWSLGVGPCLWLLHGRQRHFDWRFFKRRGCWLG